MAMKERRTVYAALVSGGVITDLGCARFAFHVEPRSDQVVREGWTIATVSPRGGTSFEMLAPLAALEPDEPKGEWPCGRGTLHLGLEAEKLVEDAKRGRSETFYRFTGPEHSRANALPLYVDAGRYVREGRL